MGKGVSGRRLTLDKGAALGNGIGDLSGNTLRAAGIDQRSNIAGFIRRVSSLDRAQRCLNPLDNVRGNTPMYHESLGSGTRLPIHEKPTPEGLRDDEIEVSIVHDHSRTVTPKLQV